MSVSFRNQGNPYTLPDLNDVCSICVEPYCDLPEGDRNSTVVLSNTQCHHFFHEFCLEKWLQKDASCPMCRSAVYEKDLTTIPLPESLPRPSAPAPEPEPVRNQPARPSAPAHPIPPAPADSKKSVFNKVVSGLAARVLSALRAASPQTIQARLVEIEHRIVEVQLKWDKMPVLFNQQKEEMYVGLASVRSLFSVNSKEALKAVNKLESITSNFERRLAALKAAFAREMVDFSNNIKLVK